MESPPPVPPLPRRLASLTVALAAVIAASCWIALADPTVPGRHPACPVLALTGLYCPGCGGLRGAHALLHGDPLTALRCNALLVAGCVAAAVSFVTYAARGRVLPSAPSPRAFLRGAAAVAVLFTVLRNLPPGALLTP
ncbi:DUF2752 domain-containing protein [Streptomyces sp. RFCAC02]|uniref:DUF2752 domain-containing protein n=1 Tax=Streptomyces sp. RFCAC02 TaxID=2499143 RepID=UPI00101F07D6|nr:DUF2752 domain-containing protein [Streptomyces sp. RFCAC02]